MITTRQAGTLSRVVPCEDCPRELLQRITLDCDRLKLLARQGLWTEATTVFRLLRDACLDVQPKTVDPFDLPIADTLTQISAQLRHELESIGVLYVGQLAHVPHHELMRLRIGPVGWRQLKFVCQRYGVTLRTE